MSKCKWLLWVSVCRESVEPFILLEPLFLRFESFVKNEPFNSLQFVCDRSVMILCFGDVRVRGRGGGCLFLRSPQSRADLGGRVVKGVRRGSSPARRHRSRRAFARREPIGLVFFVALEARGCCLGPHRLQQCQRVRNRTNNEQLTISWLDPASCFPRAETKEFLCPKTSKSTEGEVLPAWLMVASWWC